MCQSHRHSGTGGDVAVLPRNAREARLPERHETAIELASETIAPPKKIAAPQTEATRIVERPSLVNAESKVVPTHTPQPTPESAAAKPAMERPDVDLSRANFGSMRRLNTPIQSGDAVKTGSSKQKATPPRPAVASSPAPQQTPPNRPQSYVQPNPPKAPEADLKKAITNLLSTAISQQGNYSGTQKSQLPRILKWQDDLLNGIHQAIDGTRFKGADLRPGVARNASLEFIRSKVSEIAGKDVALPKFLQK